MVQGNAFWGKVAVTLLWLGGGYVFLRWLFSPLLPFLLALGLGALLEPWVGRLSRRLGGRRKLAAGLVTTLALVVAGGGLLALLLRLWGELRSWSEKLPEMIEDFPILWNGLLDRVERWYAGCPGYMRTVLDQAAETVLAEGNSLVGAVGGRVMTLASDLVSVLPDAGLFLATTVLAVYFVSLSYPEILGFLKRQMPARWQGRCRKAARCCRTTLLRWLRAEGTLLAVTFLVLLVGFLCMRLNYALLAAAFIALVDALPVLGTGVILVPWALISLALGDAGRALGLAVLYAVVTTTHTLLEPRLLAKEAELPPVAALLAMYLGFRFMGVKGMILFPFLLLMMKQLQDGGVIQVWR